MASMPQVPKQPTLPNPMVWRGRRDAADPGRGLAEPPAAGPLEVRQGHRSGPQEPTGNPPHPGGGLAR